MKQKQLLTKIGLYTVYILISLFFLYPILWVLSYSFKTVPELFAYPPRFLPKSIHFANYFYVLKNTSIAKNLWNSFYIVMIAMAGTLAMTIPAAYAFSRIKFKAASGMMFVVLVFQMISPLVIAIPLYTYFSKLGMINSHLVLIFVYVALSVPTATWNIRSYLDTIPKEIDEAATIDGCSRMGTLLRIHIPTASPGIISASLMIMVAMWSQFVVPFILLNSSQKFPISVGLVNLQSSSEAITTHYLAAACILGILPTTIAFILLQRFIVSAMTDGAVKG